MMNIDLNLINNLTSYITFILPIFVFYASYSIFQLGIKYQEIDYIRAGSLIFGCNMMFLILQTHWFVYNLQTVSAETNILWNVQEISWLFTIIYLIYIFYKRVKNEECNFRSFKN